MSDRERWIVYPLLFLAIGLALSNSINLQEKLQDVDHLQCKTLEIVGPDSKPRVKLGVASNSDGFVETVSDTGAAQTRLSSNSSGATLSLFDHDEQSVIRLGHDNGIGILQASRVIDGKIVTLPLFSGPLQPLPNWNLKPTPFKKTTPSEKQQKSSTEPGTTEEPAPDQK